MVTNGHALRHQRTKSKIMTAAKFIFLEKGYQEATVTLIATEANVGYGTVYAHFPAGKEQLLLSIMDEILEQFYAIAERTYVPKTKEEAYRFTFTNVKDFLELGITYKHWMKIFYHAIGTNHMARKKWEAYSEKFIQRISRNVEQVREMGLINNTDYVTYVVAGMLYYSGEKFLWKIAKNERNDDYIKIAHTITEMYTNGLYK